MLRFLQRGLRICGLLLLLPSIGQAQNREILGEYKIGLIGRDALSPSNQATLQGARDAALELSRKYVIDVELLDATPNREQGEDQPLAMAELFAAGAAGFIISPEIGPVVRAGLEFAQQQGQQFVFFENDFPGVTASALVRADETAAGKLLGEAILAALPTRGRLAILMEEPASARAEERLVALRASVGHQRIQKIVTCEPDYRSAVHAIEAATRADNNHQISGWVLLEDWPLRGMPTLPWTPGKKPTVAMLTSPVAFLFMDAGYVSHFVTHPYYQLGYQSVIALVESLHNQSTSEPAVRTLAPIQIDWRNLEAQRKQWQLWLK